MRNGLHINEDGDKRWYKNDKFHNENGPAVEYTDGTKWWCINGEWHRLDGPAREWNNGYKEWYYQGQRIDCSSQEEFEHLIKLKVLW